MASIESSSLLLLQRRMENITQQLSSLNSNLISLSDTISEIEAVQVVDVANLDHAWVLLTSFLVFFMQTGFMILETGGVSRKVLYESIILKNMINSAITALGFYLIGYGLAFGHGGAAPSFSGANYFALTNSPPLHKFFWQWSFLSICATIPSGAMAERTRLRSHCFWVVLASLVVYPLCAHWMWSSSGWLSPQLPEAEILFANGVLDFAGSGVVHVLGGTAGLVGAIIAGRRVGRYEDIYERKKLFLPQNIGEMALGTFILWFSWYGFNCGSSITLSNTRAAVASKVAVTTTISASEAGIVALLIVKFKTGKWSLISFLNGLISGLVSITGPCAYVEPWASFIIGSVSGVIYYWATLLERYFKIDDVIEVGPVHLANGLWGLLAVGLFATKENIFILHGRSTHAGLFVGGGALQLAMQLLAAVIIIGWSLMWSLSLFWLLKATNQLRIDPEWEKKALQEDLLQIEVEATLQLMAHNYDMDSRHIIRNVEGEPTSSAAGDPPVLLVGEEGGLAGRGSRGGARPSSAVIDSQNNASPPSSSRGGLPGRKNRKSWAEAGESGRVGRVEDGKSTEERVHRVGTSVKDEVTPTEQPRHYDGKRAVTIQKDSTTSSSSSSSLSTPPPSSSYSSSSSASSD